MISRAQEEEEAMSRTLRRLAVTALLVLACASAAAADALRIGTTAVFLDDQAAFLKSWGLYIEARISRPVQFVQRGSYREITELMRNGNLDLAWVCSPPYLNNRDRMVLAVVPIFRGKPLYQSYLIVPAADHKTKGFEDLRGAIYAFSDPDSNSGWLAPQTAMRRAQLDPRSHFKRTFFTWAHKKVVEAVAVGLAQGGSVDGYVWETLAILHPEITSRTRVAWKSPWYGFPPVVARAGMPKEELARIQDLFVGMKDDPEGRRLLAQLNLDGFSKENARLFESVEQNLKLIHGG
jgi:phosphonate transport system substrate-binding protein